MQGCLNWQTLGRLDPPKQVVDATVEYFEAEDALGRWLEERCVPNANALTAELFHDWKQWTEATGEFTGSQRRFSDLLITRGVEKWRNSVGGARVYGHWTQGPASGYSDALQRQLILMKIIRLTQPTHFNVDLYARVTRASWKALIDCVRCVRPEPSADHMNTIILK